MSDVVLMVRTFRVTLVVSWPEGASPRFPQAPRAVAPAAGGSWIVAFDVEGESFDRAAGRLWGEAAACGLTVLAVERTRPAA